MSAVKALQQWCKIQCTGYRDVSITNMTTSFRDGLAFCALIHKHRPELINFDSLKKDDVYNNNKLAFSVAEEHLGIPALLDAEDMVALKVPDRLSILTYVSQYYNYFHGRSPIGGMAGVKRPAGESTEQPSGKKNHPVTAKTYPGSAPSQPPSSPSPLRPSPKPGRSAAQMREEPRQAGTLSNKCVSCHKHVHLVQRHLLDGRLYHRNCAKCAECAGTLLSGATTAGLEPGTFICSAHQRGAPPLQERHDNTPAVPWRRVNPRPTIGLTPSSASTPASTPASIPPSASSPASKLGPSWLTHRPPASAPASTPPPASSPASKLGPSWLTHRPPASAPASTPPPASSPASTLVSKPGPSWLTSRTEKPLTPPSPLSSRPTSKLSNLASSSPSTPFGLSSLRPVATPPTSSSRTQQARARFFQSDTASQNQNQEGGPARSLAVGGPGQEAGPAVPEGGGRGGRVVVNLKGGLGGGKMVLGGAGTGGGQEVTLGEGGARLGGGAKVGENSKKEAASVISKETNTKVNNSSSSSSSSSSSRRPAWTGVALRKTDLRPTDMETPEKRREGGMMETPEKRREGGMMETTKDERDGGMMETTKDERDGGMMETPKKERDGGMMETPKDEREGGMMETTKKERDGGMMETPKDEREGGMMETTKKERDGGMMETTKKERDGGMMETPKEERAGGFKGRVKLKVDPSILADLGTSFDPPTPSSRTALWGKTPDKASLKPATTSVPDSSSSPADWRSKLKPVSKETRTRDSPSLLPDRKPEEPSRPWAPSTGNSQASGPTSRTQGVLNGNRSGTMETRLSVSKPDYIPKQQILRELKEIESSLNQLETQGVLLETQLRRSEEEGQEDSVMDELMIDWFNLIRNKQVAMRRESELVYIARNQDLEEEQPSVEQELRRLMDKPDHLKTDWDRRREKELMEKLLEIVNDRNAIIEGLDDDRLREEEEDQQLDILMKNLDVKKDKTKKKKFNLFSWSKKDN